MILMLFSFISLLTKPIQPTLYTVYAHGIADSPYQVKRFSPAIITSPDYTKCAEFSDTQKETGYGINRLICEITALNKKHISRSKMHMAGLEDSQALHKKILEVSDSDSIVLYGCSRGAATAINVIGESNPKNIVALILDASPASMHETIHPALAKLGIHHSYDKSFFSTFFPKYHQNTTTPLESIKKIKNKNLAVLLIHSQDDSKVPYSHALQLYKEFFNNGFSNVYLLTIPQGRHAFLLQDSKVKSIYLQAVHSFYKKHNLPYDQQYAQDDMKQYQPNMLELETEIAEIQKILLEQYEQNKAKNLRTISLLSALLISFALYKKLKNI